MNLEQYIGCLIKYNGRIAAVTGARSNYDGNWIFLRYLDTDTDFIVNAFEDELLNALPDPQYGILKNRENDVVFLYNETEYILNSHPYEPCLYIKKDGAILRILHNAFNVDELLESFAQGETLMGIDGKAYDQSSFCRTLVAAITGSRTEMNFTFAAVLSRTETERHEDYKTDNVPQNMLDITTRDPKPSVMNFCPQCGRKNPGDKFCSECGTKLIWSESKNNPSPRR